MRPYYDDGSVTIYHGDCREILPRLEFDAIVSDPPYGINWKPPRGFGKGTSGDAIAGDNDTEIRDWVRSSYPDVPTLMFGSHRASAPAGTVLTLVFHKDCVGAGIVGNWLPWYRDWEPLFVCGRWPKTKPTRPGVVRTHELAATGYSGYVTRAGHPHAKPVDVLRDLLSAVPPGVVVDPFMGSGSTLRAAKDLGRRAIGIEIEERYCEIAAKRCAQEVLDLGDAA